MPSNVILQSDSVNTSPAIVNTLDSSALDVVAAMTPFQVNLYRSSVAKQMNSARPMTYQDLSDQIADITIETTVQGASLLEIQVIDPYLMLFRRWKDFGDQAFIDAYDDGYLMEIQLHFPENVSDAKWTLVAVDYSLVTPQDTGANVKLTFEDAIANKLRQSSRTMMSTQGETLAHFIGRAVNTVDKNIKVVKMIDPQDPNYTAPNPPGSATQPNPPPARQNHTKAQNATIQQAINAVTQPVVQGVQAFIISPPPPTPPPPHGPNTPGSRGTIPVGSGGSGYPR